MAAVALMVLLPIRMRLKGLNRLIRRRSMLERVILVGFLAAFVAYGGTKPPSPVEPVDPLVEPPVEPVVTNTIAYVGLEAALPGLLADYLPDGLAVGLNKTKWIVAPDEKGKAAKAGKVALNKKTGEIDETKLGENPSALKLTYTAKSGSFKGSFKAYTLDAKGKIKSYTVNVTGVAVGNVGYGTATVKKPAVSFPITVE